MDRYEDRRPREGLSREALGRRFAKGGIELDPDTHYLASIGVAGDEAWKIVTGWTRIGRSSTADICLDDPSVSRRHALIVVEADVPIRIIDDRSLNGVFVNDVLTESAPLRHGDRIAIGVFALIYIAPASVARAEEASAGASTEPGSLADPLDLGSVPEGWERAIGPLLPASEIETARLDDGGGAGTTAVATAARTSLLLSALDDEGRKAYPAFQFDPEGWPFAAVEPCLRELLASGLDPYTTAAWFVTSQRSLDGMTPAKWMREGRADDVLVEAARRSAALFKR